LISPTEIFWASAFLSSLVIRLFADYYPIRFYLHDREIQIFHLKGAAARHGVHVHHFVWGIVLFCFALPALYFDFAHAGMLMSGVGVALIASEAKELILQKWGP